MCLRVSGLREDIEALTAQMVPSSGAEFGVISPRAVAVGTIPGSGNEFWLQPAYKEATDRFEVCLFSDEPNSWEEMAIYMPVV